jgi:RNA polymerase subunit RPABC4/transcription elongation factor Spt4
MEQRTFHGNITPADLAQALIARFNAGDFQTRQVGRGENLVLQVATPGMRQAGGPTAITIHLSQVEDGVHVRLGQQQWLGTAASLGQTAIMALLRPASILSRLDDVAQDIQSLQLADEVWNTVERTVQGLGASFQISERLRRLTCAYCSTANPVGSPHCAACGAPLGFQQPMACPRCGFVSEAGTQVCPECGNTFPK